MACSDRPVCEQEFNKTGRLPKALVLPIRMVIFSPSSGAVSTVSERLDEAALADARVEIFACIGSYYNTHRKDSALAYHTPTQFEAA